MMRKIERMVHDFIAQSKEALREDRKLHEKTLKHTLPHDATMRSDRVEGVLTSTLNLWKWIMDLETAGDDGDLGQSHNDPS